MPEEENIRKLPKAQLDLIDHDIYKWHCCAEGCKGFTIVKYYGETPYYFHRTKWYRLDFYYWLCSKHTKLTKAKVPFVVKEKHLGIDNLEFQKSVTFSV